MAYATVEDVQARMLRPLSAEEQTVCATFLDDAAEMIDALVAQVGADPTAETKKVVSARMVARAIADGDFSIPTGATQVSQSALGYSQSYTMGSGASVGDLYVSRIEKKMLGCSNAIGSYSPTQELVGGTVI